MAHSDRKKWDRRYADPNRRLRQAPHDLLVRHAPPATPGMRALELACGLGYDARWLAVQGYRVDALDISFQALRQARAILLRQHLTGVNDRIKHRVNFIVADLDHFALPRDTYDLAYAFRFLDRNLFPAIRACVRPGGLVIYETFNVRHLTRRPDCDPEHVLQLGELPGYFPGWQVIAAHEADYLSTFVGRKPAEE